MISQLLSSIINKIIIKWFNLKYLAYDDKIKQKDKHPKKKII